MQLNLGEKCCAHIHGAFPFLLIKVLNPLNEKLEQLIKSTITNILSNCSPPNQDEPIVSIEEVKAQSIYGYTTNDDYFAKIFFKNPQHVQIASVELQKRALTNANMQPYYAHIPYVLQFFIGYDIFGMDLVHFDEKKVHFRAPPQHLTRNTLQCATSPLDMATRMSVEFDAYEDVILNSSLLSNSQFFNAGLKLIYTEEMARCNSGQFVGLSPGCSRENLEKTKTEAEYLEKLKTFWNNCIQTPTNSACSSQYEAFSQSLFQFNVYNKTFS